MAERKHGGTGNNLTSAHDNLLVLDAVFVNQLITVPETNHSSKRPTQKHFCWIEHILATFEIGIERDLGALGCSQAAMCGEPLCKNFVLKHGNSSIKFASCYQAASPLK